MKKIIAISAALVLTACAKPAQHYQSNIPLDMQAVHEYEQRVANGKTAPKAKVMPEAPQPLNQSDRAPKVRHTSTPIIYPSIGIGYHHGWRHHHRY
jgi:hypothetical protein